VIDVRRAIRADAPILVDAFVAALVDDPFFRWIWSSDSDGPEVGMRAWMTLVVTRTFDRAESWVSLDGAAAVTWIVPDAPLEPEDYAAVADLLESRLGDRGPAVMAAIAAASADVPVEAHRTLLYVGVRPGAQGRGLGTAVVRPGVAVADAAGLGIHLNSTNARNVPFYERLGFTALSEPVVTGDAPPILPMWRPPRG
jgi:GNAT superfamily N-acetyltransferase